MPERRRRLSRPSWLRLPRISRGRSVGQGPAGRRGTQRYALGAAPQPPPPLRWRPPRRYVIAALTLFAIAVVTFGTVRLVDGDALRVREVHVEGAEITDPHDVARLADLGGRSMLTLDADAAARRVADGLASVKTASARRIWPQGIVVELTEHQGWGYWQAAGRRMVIDEEGLVLSQARPPAPGAPTIVELGAKRPLEAGDRVDADTVQLVHRLLTDASFDRLRVTPERFEFRSDRGLTVRIVDGPDVVFGDSHAYDYKVAAWGALLDRIEAERLDVHEIDMRFGTQLVMR